MAINKVILLGRVGKDPETRDVNGDKKAEFTIATTDRAYTNKNGIQVPERTEWHNIVVWRGLAEIAERYVHKGDLIYIEGKLTTRSWESDGQKHYRTEIQCSTLELLGNKSSDKADVNDDSQWS